MIIALIAILYVLNVISAYFIYMQEEELIEIEKLLFKNLSEIVVLKSKISILEGEKDEKDISDN